jgi:hypothetical protein
LVVIVIQKTVTATKAAKAPIRVKEISAIAVAGRRLGFHGNSPQGLVRSLVYGEVDNF